MNADNDDIGLIQVLMERFEKQRLPRLVDIKRKLDEGDSLLDEDIEFLSMVLKDATKAEPLVEKHPEYKDLLSKVFQYYRTITEAALNNEPK